MIAECPLCGVSKVSHDESVLAEFQERHRTNCPGEDTPFPPTRPRVKRPQQ